MRSGETQALTRRRAYLAGLTVSGRALLAEDGAVGRSAHASSQMGNIMMTSLAAQTSFRTPSVLRKLLLGAVPILFAGAAYADCANTHLRAETAETVEVLFKNETDASIDLVVSQADKNPTWTIMALSWRTSDFIIDQLKKQNI